MVRAAAIFAFAAALMFSMVPGAQALVVSDTTWTCGICTGPGGTAVAITNLVGAWAPETTGQWISFAQTGGNGAPSIPGPAGGTDTAFTSAPIDFGSGSVLKFKLWADDTALLPTLDGGGVLTFLNPGLAPNNAVDSACAAGVIGCQANEFGEFQSNTLSGFHTLTVTMRQAADFGGSPNAFLLEGGVAVVPEPATILLLGSALATAGVVSRRRFRRSGTARA
jgi:hypothetical protein